MSSPGLRRIGLLFCFLFVLPLLSVEVRGQYGALPLTINFPVGITYNRWDQTLYVSDSGTNTVKHLSVGGTLLASYTFCCPALSDPRDLAVDSAGYLYVLDAINGRVVKVNILNYITTTPPVVQVFTTSAPALYSPYGMCLDASDNVIIADTFNNRIVELYPNGTVQAVLTTTSPALNRPAAVTVDPISQVLYVADTNNNRILKRTTAGGSLVSFYTQGLNQPYGIHVDWLGNVFVSDTVNDRILQISSAGVLLQVLTTQSPSLNLPNGLVLDEAGNLYVTDPDNTRVVQFTQVALPPAVGALPYSNDILSPTFVWFSSFDGSLYMGDLDGQVLQLTFSGLYLDAYTLPLSFAAYPGGICTDSSDALYVVDVSNAQVVKFASNGSVLHVFTSASMDYPYFPTGIAVDASNNIFVADTGNDRVLQLSASGALLAILTTTNPSLDNPSFVAVDPTTQALFVADSANNRIVKLATAGGSLLPFYSAGLSAPAGIVVDWSGDVFVSDTGNNRIIKVSSAGVLLQILNVASLSPPFSAPNGLSIDQAGNLYGIDGYDRVLRFIGVAASPTVAKLWVTTYTEALAYSPFDGTLYSGFYNLVFRLTTAGLQVTFYSFPTSEIFGLCVDSLGWIYAADGELNRVVKFASNGTILQVFTTSPALNTPLGVAVDASFHVYITDCGNNRVVELNPTGTALTVMTTTNPVLSCPYGIAVDPTSQVLYVADSGNNRIWSRISAGAALSPFYNTGLDTPIAVAVDWTGNVFISDLFNNRILHVSSSGILLQILNSISPAGITVDVAGNLYASTFPYTSTSDTVVRFNAATQPRGLVAGSMCVLMYGIAGNIDFPWSVSLSLKFQYYLPTSSVSKGGMAIVYSGSGTRTYNNRFGGSFTTAFTIAPVNNLTPNSNLLYLNSSTPFDSGGFLLNFSSLVQLPGVGPSQLYSTIQLYNSYGVIVEGGASKVDGFGQAILSSVPGFMNITIGASNINSLAALASTCQAPITYTNGLRQPTQPSASNGGVHISYYYYISDGATYSIATNLSITTTSAFATLKDQLGSPYQIVSNITGVRVYTDLTTGTFIASHVSFVSYSPPGRFYPYALLSASPGVYSSNTAPYIDAVGLTFVISDLANGGMPGEPEEYTPVTIQLLSFNNSITQLVEANSLIPPLFSLQQQYYIL